MKINSTIEQILPQQPETVRMISQLNDLGKVDPPLTFRISHKIKRTLLFIQVNPSKVTQSSLLLNESVQFNQLENESYEINQQFEPQRKQNQNYWLKNRINNSNLDQMASQCIVLQKIIDPDQLQEIDFSIKLQDQQILKKPITFVLIIHHELYPYQPPMLAISSQNSFPRMDDCKNYYYDAMQTDKWWPLVTLSDIIQKLPKFAYRVNKLINKHLFVLNVGDFSMEHPLWKQDILEMGNGLLIVVTKAKLKKQGLMTFSQQKVMGLSCHSIVAFCQKQEQQLWIQKVWSLQKLMTFKLRQGKKHLELIFSWQQDPDLSFKIPFEQMSKVVEESIKMYACFYQILNGQKIKQKSQKQIQMLIQLYSKLILLGDSLKQTEMILWARKNIKIVLQNYKIV